MLDGRLRFLIGEHDPFVSAEELREYDARELPGAGHLANLEQPEAFNRAVGEFLSSVRSTG